MDELAASLTTSGEGPVVEMMVVEDTVEVLLVEEEYASCYLLLSLDQ